MPVKKCAKCGKEFFANTSERICQECKYTNCVVCGKRFYIDRKGRCTCSAECHRVYAKAKGIYKRAAVKTKETMLEKYGVENASQVEEFKEKRTETIQKRYGEKNAFEVEEFKKKSRQTCNEKYGKEWYTQTDEYKERATKTNLERYGVENPFASEGIKEKISKTNLERYGAENPFASQEIKEKMKRNNLEKYGVENYTQTDEYIKSVVTDSTKFEEFKKFRENPRGYIESNFIVPPTITEIAEKVGVRYSSVGDYIRKENLYSIISFKQSTMEVEVKEFLVGLQLDTQILMHDRKVIAPQELDFYLPEYKLAIECNPTYTHNSSVGIYGIENKQKAVKYHQEKSRLCAEKGILLFHIYGYEWTARQEIIKSMIRNLLGKNTRKIYARNCYAAEITQNDINEFLNENHRQGKTAAKYRLGLRVNGSGELVAVMCFNKLRNTLKDAKDLQGTGIIELTRFCSLLNTTVVGGASKMFKEFVKNYDFNKIISYSDTSHTKGGVYEKLGFTKTKVSAPTYRWVNMQTDEVLNREACRKGRLRKLFNDNSIDIERQTESEIMESHGYVKVYDSGLIRWEYEQVC